MKYIVTRTSNGVDDNPGVEKVHKEIVPYVFESWSMAEGKEELRMVYTIELDSLESLHQLIKDCKHPIVLSNPDKDGGYQLPRIEIYDDYRE